MATQTRQETQHLAEPAVLMRVVEAPVARCGECVFHIPHATRPDGWCACRDSELRWQSVAAAGAVCDDFAAWPEGSPVATFLAAMRF